VPTSEPRRVKDYIEISEYTSLDDVIRFLEIIRDSLPADCQPEVRIRGDDVFGHRLTISFLRELSTDEAALEAKYSGAPEPAPNAAIDALRAKLDQVPFQRTVRG
jgi:hypothetical protein